MAKKKIAILGASGYTGAELIRHLINHPEVSIHSLTADRYAGYEMADVYPHLANLGLPKLVKIEEVDWGEVDFVFCGLPHGTTQTIISNIESSHPDLPICDLSADFRLRDIKVYDAWYGRHKALNLQAKAVYGVPEMYRDEIRNSNLIANPGCFPVSAELPLVPLLKASLIQTEDLIIDSKTGPSGAGRSPKEAMLFTEVSEGFNAYGVASHRHAPEIDQELSAAAGSYVTCTFTPHLIPQNRGILSTIYAKLKDGVTAEAIHTELSKAYSDEPFVEIMPLGKTASTRFVRGSNKCQISVHADRQPNRLILCSAIDNLVKGASGIAIQNMNIRLGFEETTSLSRVGMFP